MVGLSADFAKVLKESPLLSFRRPKNLKDHLVRSKLRKVDKGTNGMFKCGKKRCQVCNYISLGNKVKSKVTGKTYYVNHIFVCVSEAVVYLITCRKCGLQSVGNTVTSFRLRFNNHKSSIVRYGNGQRGICGQSLYAHFYTEQHECLKDLEAKVIDVTDVNKPNERESFWIEKLNTDSARGLNVREET